MRKSPLLKIYFFDRFAFLAATLTHWPITKVHPFLQADARHSPELQVTAPMGIPEILPQLKELVKTLRLVPTGEGLTQYRA